MTDEIKVGDRIYFYEKDDMCWRTPHFGIIIKVFKNLYKIDVVSYEIVEMEKVMQFKEWYKPNWDDKIKTINVGKNSVFKYSGNHWATENAIDTNGNSMKDLSSPVVPVYYD